MKITTDQLARRLESVCGAAAVRNEMSALSAHIVDGKIPALICAPETPDQVADALRICNEAAAAVIPWGGSTAMSLGNPPRQVDLVLQLHRLDRVIDHDHANLTVTVQSGITLNALQSVMSQQNQLVPFDAPFPDRTTVGGIVAANLNGPRRMSYGSVRDLIIGMKVALASGELIRAGGKVVKNVAGYDMCKLFTGSLGTLGIIPEVTLRVAPIPASSATVIAEGTLPQTVEMSRSVVNSKLLPTGVFLRNQTASQNYRLQIAFDGFATTVARQVSDVTALAQRHGLAAQSVDQQQQIIWQEVRDFPLQQNLWIFRLTRPRGATIDVIQALQGWRAAGEDLAVVADLAMGTVWIAMSPATRNVERFAELIALAQGHRGHAVIFAAPFELKTGIDIWGPASSTLMLMRNLKQQFDPQCLLNPGRFIGGI